MADTTEPLLQECATCGTLIDVSDEEPFALMHCPTCGAAMRVRRQFGNFELQEVLGAGGMGAVYRALDTALGRPVALKLLRKEYTEDPEFVKQFEHEASITALINHPNVVKVYSTAFDHGLYYIAMELVDKGSLDDLMTLQGSVAEPQVLEVGIQIAQGLNAAFLRGLIHRDVKPGNILFADAHHAKIVDFGLARLMEHGNELTGEVWGTPYYVAPEKLDNPPKEDIRSDIYSLGATLFHALAGRPPYEAENASMVALKHLKSQPVSLQAFAPNVTNATAYVINRTLQKDPEQRYSTYEELIEHLEYARSEFQAASKGPRLKTRLVLEDERSERMMSWVTLGILAALVIGGIGLYLFRDKVFGPSSKPPVVASHHPGANSAQTEESYHEAQQQLANGKFEEAATTLEKLGAAPDAQQPERNWILLQAGISQILNHHLAESRADFQKVVDAGPYTFDPSEEKLANFFLAIAKLGADPAPAPASMAKDYSKSNYEAMALLILAAKDWELGHFDDAGPLFRQFHSASPDAPFDWMTKYRDLANRYIAAYTSYREIPERIKAAHGLTQQKAALAKVKETLTRPELNGKLGEKAASLVDEFEKTVSAAEEQDAKKRANQETADTKILGEAKAKIATLCGDYKYTDAEVVASGIKASSDKMKLEKETLEKRLRWLAAFKTLLIEDINAHGYANGVVKKGGATIPGSVARADETRMQIQNPYGVVPFAWSDLAPEWVYTAARSYIRAGLSPDAIAQREWGLGIYAVSINRLSDGKTLLETAAKNKPEYQTEIQGIPEAAGATPAPQ